MKSILHMLQRRISLTIYLTLSLSLSRCVVLLFDYFCSCCLLWPLFGPQKEKLSLVVSTESRRMGKAEAIWSSSRACAMLVRCSFSAAAAETAATASALRDTVELQSRRNDLSIGKSHTSRNLTTQH